MSKLLQIAGVAALILWTAVGGVTWMLTKEQVHVTIEPGRGERAAADPIAAVAERVQALEVDLRALTKAWNENLRALDDGIEAAASERAAAAQTAIARLEANLAARSAARAEEGRSLHAELSALRGEVDSLSRAVAAIAAAPPRPGEAAAPDAVVAAQPPAEKATVEAPMALKPVAQPVATEPVAEATPAPKPRKKSFLAFELPSDSFSFAGRQEWQVIPSLSRVGFDAKSTLHDFTGASTKVEGSLTADLAHPADRAQGTIVVEAASLDTGLADRNAAMYEHLATKEHARIRFELIDFEAQRVDGEKMQVTGNARGKMTIHGQTRDVTMPVRLGVDASRRLVVEGEMALRMADYGVEVPSKLGLISMQDEVKVWIALRARPLARESH